MKSAAAETCRRYTDNLGLPHNLQAVCVAHLFTGILLLSGAFSQSATIGALLLFVSFLGVFTLCRFAPPAAATEAAPLSANLADVETALPALSVASEDVAAQLAEKQRQCADVASPAAPAVVFNHELPEAPTPGGSTVQDVAIRLAEPSAEEAAAETPRPRTSAVERACSPIASGLCPDGVRISDEASVIDGLRVLLMHHLRKSDIETLSEAQAELLEHHLARLSSYSQKIVYTISFAQRVLADAREAEQQEAQPRAGPTEEQWAATAAAVPSNESEPAASPERRSRRLKLTDGELIDMYSMAQKEAALEADWRGFGDSAILAAARSRTPFGSVEAVLAPPGVSKWRGDAATEAPTERTQERIAAIQLLGQALQAKHGGASPRSPGDDLARRLLPAPGPFEVDPFGVCCAVGADEDAGRPLEHLGRVPVLRLSELSAGPPQADPAPLVGQPVVPPRLEPEEDANASAEALEGHGAAQGARPDWHDGHWQVP